jgi:peroxiredoxin
MGRSTQVVVDVDPQLLDFDLRGVDGERHSLSTLAGRAGTVIIFAANGCPTVRSYEDRLMALQTASAASGVQVVAINSNNPHLSPPDRFPELVKRAKERHFNFPYLKDEDGAVARRYQAICTPHAFLLNSDWKIAYSGRIDDSRVGGQISHPDLLNAVADFVAGRQVAIQRTDPFGCSIVW